MCSTLVRKQNTCSAERLDTFGNEIETLILPVLAWAFFPHTHWFFFICYTYIGAVNHFYLKRFNHCWLFWGQSVPKWCICTPLCSNQIIPSGFSYLRLVLDLALGDCKHSILLFLSPEIHCLWRLPWWWKERPAVSRVDNGVSHTPPWAQNEKLCRSE